MKADLEILARELKLIAERASLPEGDEVTVPVVLWAEGWLLTLAELGIRPAPEAREEQGQPHGDTATLAEVQAIADLVVDVMHGRKHSGELLAAIQPYRSPGTGR